MSTRSAVILKVHKKDIGRIVRFNAKHLPSKLRGWKMSWINESDKEKSENVTLEYAYIGIYCHNDGYPSGVGRTLKERFSNYESILNLIAGGDCSVIFDDEVRHYANRKNEMWKWLKPKQGATQKSVLEVIDWEYAYLYDEERGGWLMKHGSMKNGFKPYKW